MDDLGLGLDFDGSLSPPRDGARGEEYDVLGLDKPIKLTTRAKIAKIDNTRIFNPQTGLNYITRNYGRVSKAIRKNEKAYAAKRVHSKSDKADLEYNNLTQVLQFYQLWCHGLFPKAPFKDCIHLIRLLGSKSPRLTLYRRELIEIELNKLRVEKGIIDDADFDEESARAQALDPSNPLLTTRLDSDGDDGDDDWEFMNGGRSNGLFVGEDFVAVPSDPSQTSPTKVSSDDSNDGRLELSNRQDHIPDNDDIMDFEEEAHDEPEDHHDEELMLMREFD